MKKFHLDDMIGGWFIGHFEPSILKTNDFEVAVKKYKKGDYERKHFHKIAAEYTIILDGEVIMSGKKFKSGDIVLIEPNESTDFKALTDVKTVVVKTPSIDNDKFLD
tara:strand:- start:2210 stop:2530 length:321 start_codon:yes stop_codon:yes gene_type:complete